MPAGLPPEEVIFQSTLPLRGATDLQDAFGFIHGISIHTPLAGSDSWLLVIGSLETDFNPHSPCGERHMTMCGIIQQN